MFQMIFCICCPVFISLLSDFRVVLLSLQFDPLCSVKIFLFEFSPIAEVIELDEELLQKLYVHN